MITGPVKFSFKTGEVEREAMAFWCVMIPRKLFDEIGLLDEIFSPGMGEDGDFCIKAKIAGHDLVQVPLDLSSKFGDQPDQGNHHTKLWQVFPIAHKGSGTFGWIPSNDIIQKNKQLLDKRYGSSIELAYNSCLNHTCDINQHFPVLRKLASECDHITELGTRGVFSTYAFMAGRPSELVSYDIELNDNIWIAAQIAKECGVKFSFMHRDTTNCVIDETDLLFIDTFHTYSQLKKELNLHGERARKYIAFHDTVSFGEGGEDGLRPGLRQAIDEFLVAHDCWKVKEHYTYNNGIMVLERIK